MLRIFLSAWAFAAIALAQAIPVNTPGVVHPKIINRVEADYTPEARASGIEGTVAIGGVLGSDGVPRELSVQLPLGHGLDEKALDAVSQWRFDPAKKNGAPISVIEHFYVTFRLLKPAHSKLKHRVEPEYTKQATDAKIAGRVRLTATIGIDGEAHDIKVMSPLGYGLDEKAVQAVSKWRWEAPERDGEKVPMEATIEVNFQLGALRPSEEASLHEEARANFNEGYHYLKGDIVPQDVRKGRYYFIRASAEGFAPAQHLLGMMYLNGEAGPQSDAEAFQWMKKSADQKYAKAQFYVGLMYTEGRGTWHDDVQALHWYRLAAEQNEPGAEAQIGWAYENGRGTNENAAEAMKWYRTAAEHGSARARLRLGQYYRDSAGVEHDPVEALAWMRLAISKDAPDAEAQAAKLAGTLSKEQLDRVDALVKERSSKP